MRRTSRENRSGLSLIEVVVSTMLVALVLIGALRCFGAVLRSRTNTADTMRARLLGRQLLTEILNGEYVDPGAVPLFGPEAGEPLVTAGPRSGWNDVDDYHLWSGSPPQDRNGVPLPNLAGWQRDVAVEWVDPASPENVSLTDQGVKRITVVVSRSGTTLATAVGLRSDALDLP
ncbi:hypothetical protein Mal4_45060 [Maioricimonas rarisocia]|uniref:Pseudopilin GspJ n=1 Tax=Maioricimonas rarisocia TaxID=2528026 RepID=A0A517ZCH3_9PLAN|nr:hypothetical protein [Maioricimonas rarisocia]QDU40151.1 hypothetical protein Mal4_45060 [Maioricimonas rarisocia]